MTRIMITSPGKLDQQERFHSEAIKNNGLRVAYKKQANALSHTMWPADLYARYGTVENLAEAQYDYTRRRMNDTYNPEGEPITHVDCDYEPFRQHEVGPASSHQWDKLINGYNTIDEWAYRGLRMGIKMATDGLKFGFYRSPTLRTNKFGWHEKRVVKSARDIIAPCHWVNLHGYPSHKYLYGMSESSFFSVTQNQDKYLRKYDPSIEVLPQVSLNLTMPRSVVVRHNIFAISCYTRIYPYAHINFWVDCSDAGDMSAEQKVTEQIERMNQILDALNTAGSPLIEGSKSWP